MQPFPFLLIYFIGGQDHTSKGAFVAGMAISAKKFAEIVRKSRKLTKIATKMLSKMVLLQAMAWVQ